ncbi:MAG: hypothetical protein K2X66_05830 [Cyanobacteria bacterium]|nr:hypothetical protein [Cyanobacteriota bacterium]
MTKIQNISHTYNLKRSLTFQSQFQAGIRPKVNFSGLEKNTEMMSASPQALDERSWILSMDENPRTRHQVAKLLETMHSDDLRAMVIRNLTWEVYVPSNGEKSTGKLATLAINTISSDEVKSELVSALCADMAQGRTKDHPYPEDLLLALNTLKDPIIQDQTENFILGLKIAKLEKAWVEVLNQRLLSAKLRPQDPQSLSFETLALKLSQWPKPALQKSVGELVADYLFHLSHHTKAKANSPATETEKQTPTATEAKEEAPESFQKKILSIYQGNPDPALQKILDQPPSPKLPPSKPQKAWWQIF